MKPWERVYETAPATASKPWEREYAGPAAADPMAAPGRLESLARGGAQGITLGFADELTGAGETGVDVLKGDTSISDIVSDYLKHRGESRENYHAAKAANPGTYMVGQGVGGAITALAAPELSIGKMAALGAIQGVGESDAPIASVDTAKQAALSGIIAGGVGAAAKGVSKVLNPETLDEVAMSSGQRAVGFTKKMLKNDMQQAQAKDATRLALDHEVLKPFASIEGMQDATESISKNAGSKMGEFLDGQSAGQRAPLKAGSAPTIREQFLFDPQKAIDELHGLRPKGLNMGDNADINAIIDKAVDTVKARGTLNAKGKYALRPIPWEDARELKTQIQGMANWDTGASRAVNDMKKALGGRIRDNFMSQLEENASARGAGEGFEEFAGNVKTYGSAATLQDALHNRFSSVAGNQTVGLRDAMAAAGELAHSGNPIAAAAVGGASKAWNRFGDSTISWSADRLSKAIKTSPQTFQKWLPALQKAMVRGPQSLSVTTFMLQQTDPEFTTALKTVSE